MRDGGEFTDDEAVLVALGAAAGVAGVAVENARLYDAARRQQRWIQASAEGHPGRAAVRTKVPSEQPRWPFGGAPSVPSVG